jgi:uncharacterized protein YydD (DUF2326 family)
MARRELNFTADVAVEKEHLDKQWIEYPSLIYLYAQEQAKLQKAHNEKKDELDSIKAVLNLGMRTSPDEFPLLEGVTKFTEAIYDSAIQIHPKAKSAREQLHQIKHDLDLINGACAALREKKYSMQNILEMVKLELIELKISSDANVREMKREEDRQKILNRKKKGV